MKNKTKKVSPKKVRTKIRSKTNWEFRLHYYYPFTARIVSIVRPLVERYVSLLCLFLLRTSSSGKPFYISRLPARWGDDLIDAEIFQCQISKDLWRSSAFCSHENEHSVLCNFGLPWWAGQPMILACVGWAL